MPGSLGSFRRPDLADEFRWPLPVKHVQQIVPGAQVVSVDVAGRAIGQQGGSANTGDGCGSGDGMVRCLGFRAGDPEALGSGPRQDCDWKRG